jgi:hypothetical protein
MIGGMVSSTVLTLVVIPATLVKGVGLPSTKVGEIGAKRANTTAVM